MTYSRTKVQGQQSVASEDRVETDEETDRGECITSHANVVSKYSRQLIAEKLIFVILKVW